MKSLDQIRQYTSKCEFAPDDWQQAFNYCCSHYNIRISKSLRPQFSSTFQEFLSWIDNGVGLGDIVGYGKTKGVVGWYGKDVVRLVAYCDYEEKLIVKDEEHGLVVPVNKLYAPNEKQRIALQQLLFDNELCFSVKEGKLIKLYTPEKYSYISFIDYDSSNECIGMYSHSEGYGVHFIAILIGNILKMDYFFDNCCTSFRSSKNNEIHRLHKAAANEGWVFNKRTNQFHQLSKQGKNNDYWYMTDRFTIVKEKDTGGDKHQERFEAGNYFLDFVEAVTFAKAVSKMRGK